MSSTAQSDDMTVLLNKITAITHHGETHLLPKSELHDNAIQNSNNQSLRPIAVTPLAGQFLSLLTRLTNTTRILEVGTLGGYSTLWFALSQPLPSSTTNNNQPPKIHVTTIEINPKHASVAKQNTNGQGVDNVEIVLGSAIDVMTSWITSNNNPNTTTTTTSSPSPKKEFDMTFIDADWGEQWECFDLAVQLTRPGGIVVVDNVIRNIIDDHARVVNDRGDVEIQGETLVTKVGRDERVTATLLNQVNALKGKDDVLDGVLIAAVL